MTSEATLTASPALDHLTDDEFVRAFAARAGIDEATAAAMLAAGAAPIIVDAVAKYSAAAKPRTRDTYATHLNRMVHGFGPYCDTECAVCMDPAVDFICRCSCKKCLTSRLTIPALGPMRVSSTVLTAELVTNLAAVALRHAIKNGIVDNRNRAAKGKPKKAADGRNAAETAVAAARSFLRSVSGFCDTEAARQVKKPKRISGERLPMLEFELAELQYVTATGGNDPELDLVVLDLTIATGVRAEGTELLSCGNLHRRSKMIDLYDKNKITVPMPVSGDLIDRLVEHSIARGGAQCDPSSPMFRPDAPVLWMRVAGTYRPMTGRRLDTLAGRWQRTLPWANEKQLTLHFVRQTMASILDRSFGPAYKKRYLRHADDNVTELYGRCPLDELARAMSSLLDFEHPLVQGVDEREKETFRRLGLA